MVHEHPGVYSSYDASSVIGGKKTARILGAAAVSTTGTANEVVTLTSYAEGVSAFGEDAEGTVGMAALLAALIARSVLQPGILCSLAVSTAAFVLVDLITAVTLLAGGRSELSAIALRAVQELALSLPLLIVCHPVLAFLHRKYTL